MTKKEVKELYEAGKLKGLMMHIISDGTKSDVINALQMLINYGGGEETITFESVPYSRGGKWKRHTSTLSSTQKWEVVEGGSGYYVSCSSSSISGNCPAVVVPKFYTEKGKEFHNGIIYTKIQELKKKLL
jgi:hypothetical protein